LFHIHLNVDFPFNLTGILYFPKLKNNMEPQRDKIQLYSNQVFITDNVENIVPEFLTLLKGVLDSPDIPLNVSRSYLQADGNVKKISSHITKKVADKLEDLMKKDRTDFENKWNDINIFIKYGMLSEEKFYERANKFFLFKTTENKYYNFEEFAEKVKETHKDKDGKTIYLYTNNVVEQHTFIETAKNRGYEVLVMDGPFDSHFVNHLESKLENVSFARVDADVIDNLIKKEENTISKLDDAQKETLKAVIEEVLPKEKYSVQFENMSEKDQPMVITQPEFMRRMMDMNKMGGGGMSMFGAMPEMYNVVVNTNHELSSKIVAETDIAKRTNIAKQAADLALLSQNMLKGEELSKFITRSLEMI